MVNLGRRRFTQSKCSLVAGDAEDTEYAFAMEIVIATAGRVQSHTTPQRYVAASRPAGCRQNLCRQIPKRHGCPRLLA
jgi:hypothetical protein